MNVMLKPREVIAKPSKVQMIAHKLESGKLVPTNPADETALLKARTLLAYLNDIGQLKYTTMMGMVFVNHASTPFVNDDTDMEISFRSGESVAAIGVLPFKPAHQQPAVAIYRASDEVHDAFVNVWLKSSLTWLEKNPADRVRLEIAFPTIA